MMKKLLERLFEHQYLSQEEAYNTLGEIADGQYTENEVSAFLTVFRMRNITIEELIGFRNCLKDRCDKINLQDFDTIDLCGTGGDGKNTFNISTLAAFVVAGAGYKVAKHGNYGISSVSGSSNVLEHFGYQFTKNADTLKRQIEKTGITFLHAPLFHTTMKKVAPIRKNLGFRTFFNMLGPMVNPASPQKQLIGVYSLELLRYYKYVYEKENGSFCIVHTMDGYDEISLTANAKVVTHDKEYILEPTDFFKYPVEKHQLYGGETVADAAKIFLDILEGKGNAIQNKVVCANASLAIQCYKPIPFLDAYSLALESLTSGNALQSFKKLLSP